MPRPFFHFSQEAELLKRLGSLGCFHFLAVLPGGGGTKFGMTSNWSVQLSTEGHRGCQLPFEQKRELIYIAEKSHHKLLNCGA